MHVSAADLGDPPPFIKSISSTSRDSFGNGIKISSSRKNSQARVSNSTYENSMESTTTRTMNRRRLSCSHFNPTNECHRRKSEGVRLNYRNPSQENKSIETNHNHTQDNMSTPVGQKWSTTTQPSKRRSPPEVVAEFYNRHFSELPKTDYTYSRVSPLHGHDFAPGIPVFPVLSRLGSLRRCNLRATRLYQGADESLEESFEQVSLWRKIVTNIVRTITSISYYAVSSVQSRFEALLYPSRTLSRFERRSRSKLLWLLLPIFLLLFLFYLMSSSDNVYKGRLVTLASYPVGTASAILKCAIWLFHSICSVLLGIVSLATQPIFALFAYPSSPDNTLQITPWSEPPVVLDKASTFSPNKNAFIDVAQLTKIKQLIATAMSQNNVALMQHTVKQMEKLVTRLESIESQFTQQFKELETRIDHTQNNYLTVLSAVNSKSNSEALVKSNIDKITLDMVKSMLETYHADRTGRPDFALQSNGGVILGVRCTKTYKGHLELSYFSFPWSQPYNGPEAIIKPGIMPGECWAFEGAEGYVDIALAMPIYVIAFTMEHTPKVLTPRNDISSAPKRFSVWGIDNLKDDEMIPLGRFEFKDNGESMQTFNAEPVNKAFKFIELKIESNHGHLEYTCLYRFRVHGQPVA